MNTYKLRTQDISECDFWHILKEDIKRYIDKDEFNILDIIYTILIDECLIYIISYRITQRILKIKNRYIRLLFRIPLTTILHRFLCVLLGIRVNVNCVIGKGFYIGHFGTIFIGPTQIGNYCNISHEVTIGVGGTGDQYGIPKLGNYIYIAPGAKLFGNITIGNHSSIGANAVVSKSIPDNSIVVGNPGRIVGHQIVNSQIHNLNPRTYLTMRFVFLRWIKRCLNRKDV